MNAYKPRKRHDPVGWRSGQPSTMTELTRAKHDDEWDLWELDGGGNWYDLPPDEQERQYTEAARAERINEIAVLSAARYLRKVYPDKVRDRDLMWDLFFAGLETKESKAIRIALIRELEAERTLAEARARARIEARIAAAGVVATNAAVAEAV